MPSLTACFAVLLFLIGACAYLFGVFFNALLLFLLVMAAGNFVAVVVRACRSSLELRHWRKPTDPALRSYRWQALNRIVFWILAGATVQLCLVPAQFDPAQHRNILLVLWIAVATLGLLELFPGRKILLPLNLTYAAGSLFLLWQVGSIQRKPDLAEGEVLVPPFRGDWIVIQGGRSSLINHHYLALSQRNALDLAKLENGRERTGDRSRRESFPAWGAMLLAPVNGKVAVVVNDLPDNPIGQTDRKHLAGNHLTIEMADGRFVLLAHLQQNSITVVPGQRVQAGDPIARCGNSGNTSQPHLHIQVQNLPDFAPTGLRTWPIFFQDTRSQRGARIRTDEPFYVQRNDELIRD